MAWLRGFVVVGWWLIDLVTDIGDLLAFLGCERHHIVNHHDRQVY